MTDSNGVQWFCHRCARKDGLELDTDPVMLLVCSGCQVENWTRPLAGAVVVLPEVEVGIVPEAPLEDGPVSSEEQAIESPEEEPAPTDGTDTVEPVDPYKGLTKAQLVELLKEKE